jgi:hypothetical protein
MTDPSGRPIVAELGRPETEQETWERKQNARVARRQHQTMINLVLSLAASLAIVLALVAVVVRPNSNTAEQNTRVDYMQVADQAGIPGVTLAAPKLPSTYWSNRADYADHTADGVDVWTVGLITPDKQYIGIHQGVKANPTWVSEQLDQHAQTGTKTIDGTRWDVYDRRSEGSSAGNLDYSLVSTFGTNTIVLSGTADNASFRQVATGITKQFDK